MVGSQNMGVKSTLYAIYCTSKGIVQDKALFNVLVVKNKNIIETKYCIGYSYFFTWNHTDVYYNNYCGTCLFGNLCLWLVNFCLFGLQKQTLYTCI